MYQCSEIKTTQSYLVGFPGQVLASSVGVLLAGATSLLLLTTQADAWACRREQFYRPSIGQCVGRGEFLRAAAHHFRSGSVRVARFGRSRSNLRRWVRARDEEQPPAAHRAIVVARKAPSRDADYLATSNPVVPQKSPFGAIPGVRFD